MAHQWPTQGKRVELRLPALLLSPVAIIVGLFVYLNRFKIFGFTIDFNNRGFGNAGQALQKKPNPRMVTTLSMAFILFGLGLNDVMGR